VPIESPEVLDVQSMEEISPQRPDRIGERWRHFHVHGDTQTGYTSWTSDRSIAEEAARFRADNSGLSGEIVVFRVLAETISERQLFQGLEDEAEWLIQGTVESVSISESEADDEVKGYE